MRQFFIFFALQALVVTASMAQDEVPTISPSAFYLDEDGNLQEEPTKSGSAPLVGQFMANPSNTEGWACNYEWRFTKNGSSDPYLVRYEENTEVTFTDAGQHDIVCYATFVSGNDTVQYTKDYWTEELMPLTCTIAQSKLEMPNAFSPNGDGINDIYRAKPSVQSIVEFHAVIYNRWGQKLFEWDDPKDGWDGTYNGSPVKDGVYYCNVKALGSDGVKYTFRRDVNLLRGFTESQSTATE